MILFSSLFIKNTSFAQTPPVAPPASGVLENVKNNTFLQGEKLTYRISYGGWLNVGETIFEIKPEDKILNGKTVYHVFGTGRSFSWYDWFFKVRDTYETYIEKENLLPVQFTRNVYEGGYTFYENILFKREEKKPSKVVYPWLYPTPPLSICLTAMR